MFCTALTAAARARAVTGTPPTAPSCVARSVMSLSTDGSASSSDGVYASTSLRGIDVPFDMAMPHEYEALAHRLRDGGVDVAGASS